MATDVIEDGTAIDWNVVLDEFRPWMVRVLRSRVDGRHVADEIVQEVCLSVLRQSNRPVDPRKVKPWLFQILTRRVADLYRREFAEASHFEQDGVGEPVDAKESWQWLAATEQAEIVAEAMSQIDEDDRFILERKFRDGWSYQQLADHFACTERSAEHRLVRAKKRLRVLLADHIDTETLR